MSATSTTTTTADSVDTPAADFGQELDSAVYSGSSSRSRNVAGSPGRGVIEFHQPADEWKSMYQLPTQALQSPRDAKFSRRETDAKEVEEEAELSAKEEELKHKEEEAKEEARRKDEELRKGEELRCPSTDESHQPCRSLRAPSPNTLVWSLSPMASTLHTASNSPTFVDSKLSACRRLISHAFSPHETVPLIEVIFTSKAEIDIIRGLRGDDAQTFIDVVHEVQPHFFFHLRSTF